MPRLRLLSVAAVVLGGLGRAQDAPVLPLEEARATGTAAIDRPPRQPVAEQTTPPVEAPTPDRPPVRPLTRATVQPGQRAPVLVDGRWVSPQWVLGTAGALPLREMGAARPRHPAPADLQPVSAPLEPARGFDARVAPPLVARYADAPVVRFVAPREALGNLLDELSLDELNRYQFRRNRPDHVPVERAGTE